MLGGRLSGGERLLVHEGRCLWHRHMLGVANQVRHDWRTTHSKQRRRLLHVDRADELIRLQLKDGRRMVVVVVKLWVEAVVVVCGRQKGGSNVDRAGLKGSSRSCRMLVHVG